MAQATRTRIVLAAPGDPHATPSPPSALQTTEAASMAASAATRGAAVLFSTEASRDPAH